MHKMHKCVSSKGLIQLWNVGQLKADSARLVFFMFHFVGLNVHCSKQHMCY